MQQKIDAAVVVLYNPDNSVYDNILSYIDHVQTLYIVDNSTQEHSLCEKLLNFKNIGIIHTGDNIGIAKALNLALENAHNKGYKWIMTFDQDTSFNTKDLELFLKSFYTLSDDKIALVSPLHNKKFITTQKDNTFTEEEYVMTSANIVNVSIARKIGAFDENLFIDEVDHEFCFRLKKYGYTILVNNTIAVNHTLGSNHKNKLNIKLYPPIRLYYMSKNYLYLKKKYYLQHQEFFQKRDRYLLIFFKNQLFYGKHPFKNVKMIFQGILDYKNNQFGKFKNGS